MVTRVRGRVNDVVRGAANKAADIARSVVPGVTVGAAISHETFMRFAANLNWATTDPAKYLYACTRGISRGMNKAHLVWQTIPESLRATGPEAVENHLAGLDWSHIVPFSAGGSNDASNAVLRHQLRDRAPLRGAFFWLDGVAGDRQDHYPRPELGLFAGRPPLLFGRIGGI